MIRRAKSDMDSVEKAITLGQADVLAGRVTPRATVARSVGVPPADSPGAAERAVVWSDAARDTYLAAVEELRRRDPETARRLAISIDHAADRLGRTPVGIEGPLPHTWETAVACADYVLVFELVTWTKAGELIAIDALVNARGDPSDEAPLFLDTNR